MSANLLDVWNAAASSPFNPTFGKSSHSAIAGVLLVIAFLLTGAFSMNKSIILAPLIAIPASLAFAFAVPYAMAAVGVYP